MSSAEDVDGVELYEPQSIHHLSVVTDIDPAPGPGIGETLCPKRKPTCRIVADSPHGPMTLTGVASSGP